MTTRAPGGALPITYLFAGIAVADYRAALVWYERLLGRPPDRLPNETEAVWQVADTGLIYVVRDVGRAGSALVTLIVDDLDAHVAALAQRGLAPGAIETVPGRYRRVAISDPEGNRVAFGEVPVAGD